MWLWQHLQWMTMGSMGLVEARRTALRKPRISAVVSGTPWSGQDRHAKCLIWPVSARTSVSVGNEAFRD